MKQFSFGKLSLKKSCIIVSGDEGVNWISRISALNDHRTRSLFSSCSSRCLRHQLKAPFVSAEIGMIEQ